MGIPGNCWKANLIVMKVTQPQALCIKNNDFMYGASSVYYQRYVRQIAAYSNRCARSFAVAASRVSKNFSC
jgi:hypothetical protein